MKPGVLAAVSVVACCIPAVALTAEMLVNLSEQSALDFGWLVWLLMLVSPYAFLAVMALIPGGRNWSVVLCASSLLLAASGLLAQLNVLPVRGFYGLGWIGLVSLQWFGCLVALGGAALVQGLFPSSAREEKPGDR